jgi:hypothetical protein
MRGTRTAGTKKAATSTMGARVIGAGKEIPAGLWMEIGTGRHMAGRAIHSVKQNGGGAGGNLNGALPRTG